MYSHHTIFLNAGIKEQSGHAGGSCHPATRVPLLRGDMSRWHVKGLSKEPSCVTLHQRLHVCHALCWDSPEGAADEVCRDGLQKSLRPRTVPAAGKTTCDLLTFPCYGHVREVAYIDSGRKGCKLWHDICTHAISLVRHTVQVNGERYPLPRDRKHKQFSPLGFPRRRGCSGALASTRWQKSGSGFHGCEKVVWASCGLRRWRSGVPPCQAPPVQSCLAGNCEGPGRCVSTGDLKWLLNPRAATLPRVGPSSTSCSRPVKERVLP